MPLNDEDFVLLSIIFGDDLSLVLVIVISLGVVVFEPPLRACDAAGHASVMTVNAATHLMTDLIQALPNIAT